MEIKLEIPQFDTNTGIQYNWVDGFDIEIKQINEKIFIRANKEGLESLANHFLNLAQENIPTGYHLHFDEYNALEENSLELIIQKK